MIAASVGNLLVRVHVLLNTTGFTLERDPMNVVNVGRSSVGTLTLFSTRNHGGVKASEYKECGKTFKYSSYLSNHLGIHTREKLNEMKGVEPLVTSSALIECQRACNWGETLWVS